jgi:hypothetical protein
VGEPEVSRRERFVGIEEHTMQDSFDLLIEKWIPVLYANGRPDRVGIRQALTEAGSIRQIAASNPMDNVALLRFLLAVLQWCKPGVTDQEHSTLGLEQVLPLRLCIPRENQWRKRIMAPSCWWEAKGLSHHIH